MSGAGSSGSTSTDTPVPQSLQNGIASNGGIGTNEAQAASYLYEVPAGPHSASIGPPSSRQSVKQALLYALEEFRRQRPVCHVCSVFWEAALAADERSVIEQQASAATLQLKMQQYQDHIRDYGEYIERQSQAWLDYQLDWVFQESTVTAAVRQHLMQATGGTPTLTSFAHLQVSSYRGLSDDDIQLHFPAAQATVTLAERKLAWEDALKRVEDQRARHYKNQVKLRAVKRRIHKLRKRLDEVELELKHTQEQRDILVQIMEEVERINASTADL